MKPTGTRPILTLIAIALVMSILGVVLDDLRSAAGVPGALLMVCLVTAAAFGLWWWVSWLLPHAPVSVRALIPGAILWAIGLDGLQLLTTYWIGPLVSRKSNTYGAVGIALAVLLWVYVFGRIIVGSSGLNATLWRRQDARRGVGTPSEETHEIPGVTGPADR